MSISGARVEGFVKISGVAKESPRFVKALLSCTDASVRRYDRRAAFTWSEQRYSGRREARRPQRFKRRARSDDGERGPKLRRRRSREVLAGNRRAPAPPMATAAGSAAARPVASRSRRAIPRSLQ